MEINQQTPEGNSTGDVLRGEFGVLIVLALVETRQEPSPFVAQENTGEILLLGQPEGLGTRKSQNEEQPRASTWRGCSTVPARRLGGDLAHVL